MENTRLIKSYVFYKDKCWFVSTIDRDSSALYGGRYAETLVWEYNWDKAERGKIVGQADSVWGDISAHTNMCELIFNTGETDLEEE